MSCEWPIDRSCLPDLPPEEDEAYEAKLSARTTAENIALRVIWSLSGRQFGCLETTVRPLPNASPGICDEAPLIEAHYRNDWRGLPLHGARSPVVTLAGPVQEIISVAIETTVLDPSEYVLEGNQLYRLEGRWPSNDMTRPLGQPGTWSVVYLRGITPPPEVGKLIGQLAAEFLTACEGGKCRLPRTVVSTTRSGVTHVFDPTRMLAAGFTGLSEIDSWLAAVNPNKLAAPARVL